MCNSIHEDHKKIKKTGIGYKLFSKGTRCWFTEMEYQENENGIINWIPSLASIDDDGFCFFLSKKELEKALDDMPHMLDGGYVQVKKIRYFKGLCRQIEKYMVDVPVEIGLCKSFQIIN